MVCLGPHNAALSQSHQQVVDDASEVQLLPQFLGMQYPVHFHQRRHDLQFMSKYCHTALAHCSACMTNGQNEANSYTTLQLGNIHTHHNKPQNFTAVHLRMTDYSYHG